MVTVSIQTSRVWHHHNGNDYGSVAVTPFVYPKVNIDPGYNIDLAVCSLIQQKTCELEVCY